MKQPLFLILISLLTLMGLLHSCRQSEELFTGKEKVLSFSTDTVYFDTVFTRPAGSAYPRSVNKQFFIVNTQNRPVSTSIFLGGGENSPYRINIDGVAGNSFTDVVIPANDSIIGFVEVTLEANNVLNPAVVYDSIVFITNTIEQRVMLAAYGWDALYFKSDSITTHTQWVNTEKPYVIINSLSISRNATLEMGPGIEVYCSPESRIWVLGTLKSEGTASNPVVLQGDRLQPGFKEVPGQWFGIHILIPSQDNLIAHTLLKNAVVGVRVDSLPVNNNPKLTIRQTRIRNCASYGILGIRTHIHAENVSIARCGQNGFIGFWGGTYNLLHCSFASGYLGGRSSAALAFNNIRRDENDRFVESYPLAYNVLNSIIYGPLDDEVILDIDPDRPLGQATLSHCLIKTEFYEDLFGSDPNLINVNPRFVNPREGDLSVESDSPVQGQGRSGLSVSEDIDGNPRPSPPSIGAYEP